MVLTSTFIRVQLAVLHFARDYVSKSNISQPTLVATVIIHTFCPKPVHSAYTSRSSCTFALWALPRHAANNSPCLLRMPGSAFVYTFNY